MSVNGSDNPINQTDYKMKAEIPTFSGHLKIEDFLDWIVEVDRFFEMMDVQEVKRVKMVAFRLKSSAVVWWDQLQQTRRRQGKKPVQSWRRMKQLLRERFLPADYEQLLYRMYIDCVQGNRTVDEYMDEFLRFSERNQLGETESQRVERYLSGLRPLIQERIGLQTMWSVPEAQNLALKAEMMEKAKRRFSYSSDRGRQTPIPDRVVIPFKGGENSKTVDKNGNTNQNQKSNPYAKPTGDICYRCKKPGHRSNVCPERKKVNLVENKGENDEEEENRDDDDYSGAEFAIEEGLEKVTLVLQRVMLAPREEGQRNHIFRSSCSVNNKICQCRQWKL